MRNGELVKCKVDSSKYNSNNNGNSDNNGSSSSSRTVERLYYSAMTAMSNEQHSNLLTYLHIPTIKLILQFWNLFSDVCHLLRFRKSHYENSIFRRQQIETLRCIVNERITSISLITSVSGPAPEISLKSEEVVLKTVTIYTSQICFWLCSLKPDK